MQAQIRVIGGNELEELGALGEWLRDEDELRGAVTAVPRPTGETELGAAFDMLAVALGSGGVGVALARSLTTWLATRRSDVRIAVSGNDRTVELEARDLDRDQAVSLLQEALRSDDGS